MTKIKGLNEEQVEVIVNFIKNIFETKPEHWFSEEYSEPEYLIGDISGNDILTELFSTYGNFEEVNREYDTCSLKIEDREFFTTIRRFGDDCNWEGEYFETMKECDMPVVPEKIFIIKGSKGTWDCHFEFTVGVFNSKELAEIELQKIVEELNLLSQKYTPEQAAELEIRCKSELTASSMGEGTLSKEIEEYYNWPFRDSMDSFNIDDFYIMEYPLNQRDFDINSF